MPANILTTDDLKEFKLELLQEFKNLLNNKTGINQKRWLKSAEVMELLNISPGTLQNFRINGTLPFTKIGGILYYDSEEINKIMVSNTRH